MFDDILQGTFAAHRELLGPTAQSCRESLKNLADLAVTSLRSGGKLLFFGNGGSAAGAQHLATEFAVRFVKNRRALAAIALTADSAVLTACGNDLGFDRMFARQIEALGQPGDVAVGLSTSGNSPNVTCALECARMRGLTAAAFAGNGGGKLQGVADPLVVVPSRETARIQEMHIVLAHVLCAEVERQLGLG